MSSTSATPEVPKRLVFNGRFLAQSATGVQRYAQETLLAIDELLSGPDAPSEWANTRFELAVPAGARKLPRALRRVVPVELSLLAQYGHVWEQGTLAWHARGAFLVGFNYSGPISKRQQLITIHDAAVRAFPESYSRTYRWIHDALVTVLGRRAAQLMTVSEFSRQELAQRYGLDAARIVVGHEGWEHAVTNAAPEVVRQRFGVEPGQYLLCVGSLKASKGLDTLARALRRLPSKSTPGLVIALAGAADSRLFPMAEGRDGVSADPRIRHLGFVSDDDLFALYRHARALLMPSLYEGFGLPAVEALANGCPVLAARSASLPEVLGQDALWFEPGDDAALARSLSELPLHRPPSTKAAALRRHRWALAAAAVLDTALPRTYRQPFPVAPSA